MARGVSRPMPAALKRRLLVAWLNDEPVRVAEDGRAGMTLLVLDDSPVLLLEPVRRALVIVVEERNERPCSLRQHRVSRLRDPAVFTVSNKANLVMRPLDLLDELGGSVGRAVIDDDDLARRPRLCERAIHRTPDSVFRVVARDPDGDERPMASLTGLTATN